MQQPHPPTREAVRAGQQFVAPPVLPRTSSDRPIYLVNFRNHRDIYPPFGILYVADALMQLGFRVRLFHETDAGVEGLVRDAAREQPVFVGFSTITGPQLKPAIDASTRLLALGLPVVWGGVHATIMPLDVLKEDYVDFVVVNEGEVTSQELALQLAGDLPVDYPSVPGLAFKTPDGPQMSGERPFLADLDQFSPRWSLLGDLEPYLIPSGPYDRAIPVYISRGCPFRCGFCYNEVVMKRTWRQHSDDFIVEQVRWLKETHGINAVDYADDYLFGRPRPMQRLVEKVDMPWSGQVRVQSLTPAFVQWMRETGCQWVNIGAESASQAVLGRMQKDQKAWQIEWGIRNLVDGAPDVEANISFIVGLPSESHDERRLTLDIMDRLCSLSENVRSSVCVYMPYPGTPLWETALREGYVAPEQQDGWCEFDLNRGNTPWMDDAEARVMCDIDDILFVGRSRAHWVLNPYYALLRWRWRHAYFRHYWEGWLKRALINSRLRPVVGWVTSRLVRFNPNTHKGKISEGADLLGLGDGS